MAEKRLAAMVENEEMRLRTAVRIQNAIEAQKSILIKKRMEFEERSRRNEERKREFEEYQHHKIEATRAKGAKASSCALYLQPTRPCFAQSQVHRGLPRFGPFCRAWKNWKRKSARRRWRRSGRVCKS
jgi:hypothetical protein